MKVAILDYGMGNLLSVVHGFKAADAEPVIVESGEALSDAGAIVLPGVGAFGNGMTGLRSRGFVEALDREVREKKKPFLGICLGLQLVARASSELGDHAGLGWFEGTVERLEAGSAVRIPHIGWNDVEGRGRLFEGIPAPAAFYFVHSFHFVPGPRDELTCSMSEHGTARFVAAFEHDNVFAVQFHPEKSHRHGIALLRNFVRIATAG
jgi:glutamine amidotransferase